MKKEQTERDRLENDIKIGRGGGPTIVTPEFLKEVYPEFQNKLMEDVDPEQEEVELTQEEEDIIDKLKGLKDIDVTEHDSTTGELIGSDTVEDKDEKDLEELKNMAIMAQENKDIAQEFKRSLRNTGMDKKDIKILEEELDTMTQEEIEALSDIEVDRLVGKETCESSLNMFKTECETLFQAQVEAMKFKRDLLKLFKNSLEFENVCVETVDALNRYNAESSVEFMNLNLENIISKSVLNIKARLDCPDTPEKDRILLELQRAETLDALELLTPRLYIENKGVDNIRKDVKNIDTIFKNLVKSLEKSTFKFTDPREDKMLERPSIIVILEDLLDDDLKQYHREVFISIFKKYNTVKEVNKRGMMLSLLIQILIVAYNGGLGVYQDRIINSVNEVGKYFKEK